MRPEVAGEGPRQVLFELRERDFRAEDEVGDQFVHTGFAPRADVRQPDRRVPQELPFDLTRFDPEPAHLDLAVHPADEGNQSPVVGAHEIAGAVVAVAVVLDEPARGFLRQVPVPGREALATEVQLGDLAGFGFPLAIDDQAHRGAGQRPSDRHHVTVEPPWDRVGQGVGRGFRRPVDVVQPHRTARVVLVPAAHRPGVELFSPTTIWRAPAKQCGTRSTTALNSAVVIHTVSMRSRSSTSASSSGVCTTSSARITHRAPVSSGTHTSKLIASKAGLDKHEYRSPRSR